MRDGEKVMKPTHRIKETGIELRESENSKDVFIKIDKNYHAWTRSDIEKLGLTLEPIVPEKWKPYLYAYIDINGWLCYRIDEKLSDSNKSIYERSPEYDLSFEDDK